MKLKIFPLITAVIILFTVSFLQIAFADQNKPPIEGAKSMSFDETNLRMFVINNDDSFSVYDFSKNEFSVSRKSLPGIVNIRTIIASPNGSSIAIFSFLERSAMVSIFKSSELFGNALPQKAYSYTLPPLLVGQVSGNYSDDSKTLMVAYGENSLFLLGTEHPQQDVIRVGQIPTRVVQDDAGRILVTNLGSQELSIVDQINKKVTARVQLGSNPREILFNKITKNTYITDIGSDDVYVINTATAKLIKKIRVGRDPGNLDYDKNTGDVFVANNSSGTFSVIGPDLSVKTVDLKSPAYYNSYPLSLFYLNTEKKLFILNISTTKFFVYDMTQSKIVKEGETDIAPVWLFGSEKLNIIFVRHTNANSLTIMDGKTFAPRRIPEDAKADEKKWFNRPQGVAVDEEKNRIFVTNLGSNTITVIDGKTNKLITKISVGNSPQTAYFQPVTRKLYSSSIKDSLLAITDTSLADYPTKFIDIGGRPYGIWINTKTNRIYVTMAQNSSVAVLDGNKDEVINTISLPEKSFPLLIRGNEKINKVYAAAYGGGFISVIDGLTNKIEKNIEVGQNPIWVRFIPEVNRVFVTVEGERKVVIIDPQQNEKVQTIQLSAIPYRIFFDRKTKYVYINHRKESIVTVLGLDTASSQFKIIKEKSIPFWGETDTIYNIVAANSKTGFEYFTNGINDALVVIKTELDGEKIFFPIFYAKIKSSGDVIYSSEALKALKKIEKERRIISASMLQWIALALLVIILLIVGMILFRRKKSPLSL